LFRASDITSLAGKERELVEEAKQYYLDVVGILSIKCCGLGVFRSYTEIFSK